MCGFCAIFNKMSFVKLVKIRYLWGLILFGPDSFIDQQHQVFCGCWGFIFLRLFCFLRIWVLKQILGSHFVGLSNFFDIPFCEARFYWSFFIVKISSSTRMRAHAMWAWFFSVGITMVFLAHESYINEVDSSNFWYRAIVGLILRGSNCFVMLKFFRSSMIL